MEHERHFITVLRSKVYNFLPTDGVICVELSLTLCPPSLVVTLQVLVWPQLLSPSCSPRTTMCSWAGHFTTSSTRSERPSRGLPATTPGMLWKTAPAVSTATPPTCSLPANSSLSEKNRNILHLYSWRKQPSLKSCGVFLKGLENLFLVISHERVISRLYCF